MKARTSFLVVSAILVAFALSACDSKGGGGQKANGGGAPPPMEVDVVTVSQGNVVMTQDLPGRLEAFKTAQVRARVEGIVEKRLFTEGSDVKAGDLYSRSIRAITAPHMMQRSLT